jgi:hypothetical protein
LIFSCENTKHNLVLNHIKFTIEGFNSLAFTIEKLPAIGYVVAIYIRCNIVFPSKKTGWPCELNGAFCGGILRSKPMFLANSWASFPLGGHAAKGKAAASRDADLLALVVIFILLPCLLSPMFPAGFYPAPL